MTSMINNYQKLGIACILAGVLAYFILDDTLFKMVAGFLAGSGGGLLLWRNKPKKISTSTNTRYRRSLRKNNPKF